MRERKIRVRSSERCGCLNLYGGGIIFCPPHEAAPVLIEALRAMLDQADETYPHFEDVRGTANRERARELLKGIEW